MAIGLQVNSSTNISSDRVTVSNDRATVTSDRATISREQAITIAKQGQASKVLKVKMQQRSSGSVYHVKLLTNEGRVKQVTVNAMSGQIEHKQ